MKRIILFVILPLALTACKDDKKNPVTNVRVASEERDLQKTWQSECQLKPVDMITTGIMSLGQASVKSVRVQYRFKGATVQRVNIAYAGADCTQDAWIFEESGQFTLDKAKKTNDGGFNIDMKFEKLKLTIKDENGAKSANAIKLCNRSDWKAGQDADVTANAKDATCYNAQVPRTNANVYRIDNKVLYFGENPANAVQPNQRPSRLSNLKFTPQ